MREKWCETMICNNPNLDLININAYTILSILSQDIEWEWNYDGQSKSSIAPLLQSGAIKMDTFCMGKVMKKITLYTCGI